MAKEIPDISAITEIHRQDLVSVVATHLGVTRPEAVVNGPDRATVKQDIRKWQGELEAARQAGDKTKLAAARKVVHRRKRALRRAAAIK
mgnify:CR=1 FL=1